MNNKITISLPNRNYDVLIDKNAVNNLEGFLATKKYSKVFVITDENVAKYHLTTLQNVLNKTNLKVEIIVNEFGEKIKSFEYLEKISEEILSKGIDRKSLIIAFGGGVIGDLSGFLASILLRGIDFIQVPTTLLAMVDSSVGGKTAINSKAGKNLIGSFYQPKLVICDIEFLKTLPKREFLCGYAEVIKYGFISDKKFFEFLQKNHDEIFALNEKLLIEIVKTSCQNKADIVAKDEKENDVRALLNFGHTFGHIFETETGYGNLILHGEAVALGMAMASKMSLNFGLINDDEYLEINNYLQKCGFVIDAKEYDFDFDKEKLTNHLFKDKKVEHGKLTFILLNKVGEAFIKKDVDVKEFEKVLIEYI